MSGMDFLHIRSHFEMILTQAIIQRTISLIEDHDEALAMRIANAVARSLSGS